MFTACVIPIHVWAIIHLLYEVPAWVLHLRIGEVVGAAAYTLALALVESILVLLFLVFLAVVLPVQSFRNHLVAQGTMLVFLSAVWAYAIHYAGVVFWYYDRNLLAWLLLYLVSLAACYLLIYRSMKLERAINSFVRRLMVLASVYIGFDLLAILIIVLRNIGGKPA